MNVVLPDGTSLHGPAEHFEGICKVYWGRKGADWRLVFIVNEPAYVLNHQHNEYAGVMPYETIRLPEGVFPKANTAIVYGLPTLSPQKTKNAQQWLAEGSDAQKLQRIHRLLEFVEKLENSGAEPIFFPYVCGRNITVQSNGELHLLGAPIDIRGFGDAYIHREINRFIDPNYLVYRNCDTKALPRPADPAQRRRYLRYGLTHMIMELAYERAVEDHNDISAEDLSVGWTEFESIFDSHLNNKNSPIEADAKFYSVLKKALGAVAGQISPPAEVVASPPPSPPPVPADSTPPLTAPLAAPVAPLAAESVSERAPLSWEQGSQSVSKYRDDDDYIKDSYNSDDDSSDDDTDSDSEPSPRRWGALIPTVLLLTVLALGGVFLWLTGIDVRDPFELKRLRVESMLSRWMQEPESREELTKAIARSSPNNLNLKYLQLLQQLSAGEPTESQQLIKEILTEYDKLSEAQRSGLMFSQSDLRTLESSFSVGTAPASAQPKN